MNGLFTCRLPTLFILLITLLLIGGMAPSPVASVGPTLEEGKIVVAEQFTGTWCPFCPGSSGALERLEDELGEENLIVLSYHNAAGRSDPYHNAYSVARADLYNITGYPTAVFNGIYKSVGGSTSPNELSIDQGYMSLIQLSQRRPRPLDITLSGMIVMENPIRYRFDIQATVEIMSRITVPSKVRFVLYEDELNYRAPNGETHFDWVVRSMLPDVPLSVTEPGMQEDFEKSFDLDSRWNRNHLGVVMLVQSNAARPEIYHAARFEP